METGTVRAGAAVQLLAAAMTVAATAVVTLATGTSASAAVQATFYVAPDGNDSNAGSIAAPFRTVEHARDVVRTVKSTMTGDIYVYLRGGSYPVSSTIEFGADDSGTGNYRVGYAAYPNETPVLEGSRRVTGWSQHSGNIWKAPLDRSTKLRALYVNDKRAVMASKTISSQGCYGTYTITAGQAAWAWESGSQCAGARYNSGDFPAVAANQDDLEIETATTWTTAIVGVRQVTTDGGSRVAHFQQPGAAIAQGAYNGNAQVEGLCKNIEIKNNYLYDSAVLFNGHSPISAYFVDTLTVQRNRIEKAPWAGITLGWGWWNFDGSSGSIAPNRPTTTARNNTISYNQIVDTVQRLGDTAPIYTLGSQPGTTITNNYLQGVPSGHKYGLHPDEGSAYLTFRDNLLSVDKNVTWLINSDDWGRKHDLSITNTYGPINKVSNKNLPNSTVQDILVSSDYVWPAAAYSIAVSSGLAEPAGPSLPDHVLPASTFVGSGTSSLQVRSTGDASRRIWLAPSGTTTFVAGPTMTTAEGTATSIAVPSASGDYRLFVVDAQGNRSAESASLVRRQGGSQQSGRIVGGQSGRCVDVPSASTANGTQVQLWDCDGSAKQQFAYTSNKQFMVYGNKCLDAYGNGTANGTAVIIWDCHGGLNQQWNVNANGTITSAQSGLCIDATNAGTTNGTKVILWTCNGGANQRWTL